jgi:hypothetical protein
VTRKRKQSYPPPITSTKRVVPDGAPTPRTTIAIDLLARKGRTGLTVGARVRIVGGGLYAGETAVIDRFTGSVVPAAVVRTESGRSRQVRTIDLEPLPPKR